jgi:hypothetical protein
MIGSLAKSKVADVMNDEYADDDKEHPSPPQRNIAIRRTTTRSNKKQCILPSSCVLLTAESVIYIAS